uniref:Uncharacterized protein n=1 Tax=Arundo donax TaxID=35708 RepID=A0A0A9DNV0_ARUDO
MRQAIESLFIKVAVVRWFASVFSMEISFQCFTDGHCLLSRVPLPSLLKFKHIYCSTYNALSFHNDLQTHSFTAFTPVQ